MFKRKKYFFFLLTITGCFLAFYFLYLLPITFSREIPVAEEMQNPDPFEEENGSGESPTEEISPGEMSPVPDEHSTPGPADRENKGDGLSLWDESLLEQLSFLQSPIPGALVTSRDSQLPGAPRAYRNGSHEGLDYYDGACGVPIRFGDPVYTAGDGEICRIDHLFTELAMQERDEMLLICSELEETPADILDKLRGRQVWIRHANGVITIYAHLSQVAEELQEGDFVQAGDFIGNIGNSGTSDGVSGSTANSHLHFEIWIGERYLGEDLPAAETRKILKEILE